MVRALMQPTLLGECVNWLPHASNGQVIHLNLLFKISRQQGAAMDGLVADLLRNIQGVALLRRFQVTKKGWVALLRRANFEKGTPGRVDTSGTKTTIKTQKCWKCDLP